jgi:hypothetical protein
MDARARDLWGLVLEDSWVWELDSSSGAKWSRHIVVRMPGAAFGNNLAMGAFVQQIMARPLVNLFIHVGSRLTKGSVRRHTDY